MDGICLNSPIGSKLIRLSQSLNYGFIRQYRETANICLNGCRESELFYDSRICEKLPLKNPGNLYTYCVFALNGTDAESEVVLGIIVSSAEL